MIKHIPFAPGLHISVEINEIMVSFRKKKSNDSLLGKN
jgi:hypothetical protein